MNTPITDLLQFVLTFVAADIISTAVVNKAE